MPVRAYRVDAGMVHVDLGGDAFMAFPETQIDRIEDPRRALNLKPSTGKSRQKGRMVATAGRNPGSAASRGASPEMRPASSTAHQPPDRYNPGQQPQTDDRGNYTGSMGQGIADPSQVSNGQDGGLRGAQRVGGRNVMPGNYNMARPRAVNVQMRGSDFTPPGFNPPNTNTGGGGTTGDSGAGDSGSSGDSGGSASGDGS